MLTCQVGLVSASPWLYSLRGELTKYIKDAEDCKTDLAAMEVLLRVVSCRFWSVPRLQRAAWSERESYNNT